MSEEKDLVRSVEKSLTSWKKTIQKGSARPPRRPRGRTLFGPEELPSDAPETKGRKGTGAPGQTPSPRVTVAEPATVTPPDRRLEPQGRLTRRVEVPDVPETRAQALVGIPDEPEPSEPGAFLTPPGSETLQNFVWDKRNAIAYQAVLDTALRPRRLTQMLFLYGDRGLGKTHLLAASRRELANRGSKVTMVTAEQLVRRYVDACDQERVDELFAELAGSDVLILDEVHRLGLKTGSCAFAERLISNHLESGRLVIAASRHHPHAIYGLSGRQASLFMAGFIVRLDPPEAVTRERWLRQVHRHHTGQEPTREVHWLAHAIDGGLGELSYAYHRWMLGTPIDEIIQTQRPDMDLVVTLVAQAFSVDQDELVGRGIRRNVSASRDAACFVANRLGFRAGSIGAHLGGRSATTVRQARKRCADRMTKDARFAKQVKEVLQHLFDQQAG